MASHGLSGLTGTKENRMQGPENSITSGLSAGQKKDRAGDSPSQEGFLVHYDGPNDHTGILEYYFGNPTSSVKSHGAPKQSQW